MSKRLNILFVHQNFPAQYRHLAPALAARGHTVVALGRKATEVGGVRMIPYRYLRRPSTDIHPLVREHEVRVIRGEAVAAGCRDLKRQGFTADVIYAHPGWGEALFLRDVFPRARIIAYCEYYYNIDGQDVNFDPEFPALTFAGQCKLRLKNTCNQHALDAGDIFVSPTRWQRSTYPEHRQGDIQVIHDGIDFSSLDTGRDAVLEIAEKRLRLDRDSKVVTFVARHLEPMRGFHVFMRALPEFMARVSDAHVVVVGGDDEGYGISHPSGNSWREALLLELRDHLDPRRLHFVGRLNYQTYLDVLDVSSVHVYMSYPFVLSWSFLEALWKCTRVIAANVEPVREIGAANVELVDPLDARELSRALIARFAGAADPPPPDREATRAALARYSLENTLPRLMALADS